ncbi:unnamed protein product [Acanthoscelides obtectus]|uniref:FP protein C-terminal domain-containing protein n=2 Tax=Acanthoscelides obtectus TaxID=200917 RepID=A0A9P0JZL2_ACAOB|nr:unnamed protein product [Acanthoscelides obtectus]CAK1663472.1 hypothetical protein AOBTE_LOCUS23689 [Acanthoscelides obtectus]
MSQPINDQSDVITELKSLIRQLQDENKELIRSFDFLSSQWEEERKRSKVLEQMVGDLSKDNQMLRKDVDGLKLTLNKEESKRIFVDEELTKETYQLFKHSRQLKGVGYKYVWHREGKILARKNDGSDIIFIRNVNQVNDLLALIVFLYIFSICCLIFIIYHG